MVLELGRALDGRDPLDAPPEDDAELLDAYSRAVSAAAERLIPSVASLRVTRNGGGWPGGGAGSAVVVTADGVLLTSAHVVAGADRATAVFVDGREVPAKVVGRDPLSDLAVDPRDRGRVPPSAAGRCRAAEGRPARHRGREPARVRRDGDGGRGLGAGPVDGVA